MANSCDGIAQSHARVRIASGVQNDNVEIGLGLLNPGHQFTLVIRLSELDIYSPFFGSPADLRFNVLQAQASVNGGFALTKQVKIWPNSKTGFSLSGAKKYRPHPNLSM